MSDDEVIKSRPFDAPFVRVRGRLSRQGVVTWSPCLRTFHPPSWVKATKGGEQPSGSPTSVPSATEPGSQPREGIVGVAAEAEAARLGGVPNPHSRLSSAAQKEVPAKDLVVSTDPNPPKESSVVVPSNGDGYVLVFEDAQGKVLTRAPVRIRFFAAERQWALFTQRLPYYRDTHRVVLFRDEHELGALVVPKHLPEFVLSHPVKSHEVDVNGVLHLHWDLDKAEKANAKKAPLTYCVRYNADGSQWLRPGVNISGTSFDLDLREMPGGDHCIAQVIATNGYHTSYVETPPFAVPRKRPEILLATPRGPLLFAQGFSREEGPLVGESVVWLADGKRAVGTGASFDARRLRGGAHELSVRVTDSKGAVTLQHLGRYDGETGRQVRLRPGY
jgi:hypothetical protein